MSNKSLSFRKSRMQHKIIQIKMFLTNSVKEMIRIANRKKAIAEHVKKSFLIISISLIWEEEMHLVIKSNVVHNCLLIRFQSLWSPGYNVK